MQAYIRDSDALPADTQFVDVFYDLAPTLGERAPVIAAIQTDVIDAAVEWLRSLVAPGARLTMELAVDICAARPLHLPPPRRDWSDHGIRLRDLLLDRTELASAADLALLDAATACSCPLLQWQWMGELARTLASPPGVAVTLDRCPSPMNFRLPDEYKRLVDDTAQWLKTSSTYAEIARPFAQHLIAQQLMISPAFVCLDSPLPFVANGSRHVVERRVLLAPPRDSKEWKFSGEAFIRLAALFLPRARGARPPRRAYVFLSDRVDALMLLVACLLSKIDRTETQEAWMNEGVCFYAPRAGATLVDVGALFNRLWRERQGHAALVKFLLAEVLADGSEEMRESFLGKGRNICAADDMIDTVAAADWYVAAWAHRFTSFSPAGSGIREPARALGRLAEAARLGISVPPLRESGSYVVRAFYALFARFPRAHARGVHAFITDLPGYVVNALGRCEPLEGERLAQAVRSGGYYARRFFIETRRGLPFECLVQGPIIGNPVGCL